MKKIIPILLVSVFVLLAFGMLAGCNTYKMPENHCIVGLYKNYQLYSESERKFCEPIEQAIKGVEKDYDTKYYSVIKGAEYTIIVDDFVDNNDGYGAGIGDNIFSPAYWQGSIITSFAKTYSEKSGLQDEVFFNTDYKQIGGNVTVTFNENCTVKTSSEPYLYVGGIYEIITGRNGNPLDSRIDEYLDEDGNLGEMDGFYYLLLENEVCPHRDAWKTNLEITDYSCGNIDNDLSNAVQVQFTCRPLVVAENQELCLHIVCRTHSGKYFTPSPVYIGTEGFGMPIREHELKLTFAQ